MSSNLSFKWKPFGEGILAVCPEENLLKMYSASDLTVPSQVFEGHKDMILSVDMHSTTSSESALSRYQLVSLSRDNEIFSWKIPANLTSVRNSL